MLVTGSSLLCLADSDSAAVFRMELLYPNWGLPLAHVCKPASLWNFLDLNSLSCTYFGEQAYALPLKEK